MITTKTLIETHATRYPDMRIDDFIKLFYQNSFGPKHMNARPDEATLITYIINELEAFHPSDVTPEVEAIGHGFVRVSLRVVRDKKTTPEAFAAAFRRSMDVSEGITDQTTSRFVCQLNTLLAMIDEGAIDMPRDEVKNAIESYLSGEFRPVSHSKTYRECYHPHYRVLSVKEADKLLGYHAEGGHHHETR